MVAEYGNGTYFVHKDHLGSTRLLTKVDQSLADNLDFLPFGEQTSGSSVSTHKFTGFERDAETSLDHTWFRKYSSQSGRWMTPDPAGRVAANLAYPQSLNRYAFVLNNPMALVDRTGLWCVWGDGTHDDDPDKGGATAQECEEQGGYWDPSDKDRRTHPHTPRVGHPPRLNTLSGRTGMVFSRAGALIRTVLRATRPRPIMQKNEIDLRTVKLAVNSVFEHLIEDLGLETVPINREEDLYWSCPAPELYDTSRKPPDLTVGRLSDDMEFGRLIHRGENADASYNFVHLAPLLKYIGESVKK